MEDLHIHPMLVHFPIAFYWLELWLLILWVWKKDEFYAGVASLVFKCAYWMTFPALISGYLTAGGIGEFWQYMAARRHFISSVSAAVYYTFHMIFLMKVKNRLQAQKTNILIQALIGVMLVSIAGHFGGELVHEAE